MASSDDSSVHVLLISYPSQGHINPLLQLGKRLAAHRGVRCTLAVTRFILAQGRKPQTSAVHVVAYSDGCEIGGFGEAADEEDYLARLESAGSASVDELLRGEAAQGRPVRAVVYDAFLTWVPRVARRTPHGAACASFFTQACAVNVAYAHAWAGRVDLPVAPGRAPPELPGLSVGLGPADFPTFLTEQDGGCRAYVDLMTQQCQGFEEADHVLINSFYELEIKSRWGAKTVGPTVPSAYLDNRLPDDVSYGFHLYTPLTEESKAWLDARPAHSVVYISFGSLAAPSAGQMAEVAEGLYNSGKDFLWVVRASETSKIPQDFHDKVKGRGLIVTWSPQLEFLNKIRFK
nr:unnamed protein product [Digitaria exilis]